MTRQHISVVVVISILSMLVIFPAAPARAATITVTSKLDIADPGKCRLRDAITAANTNTATGDCPVAVASRAPRAISAASLDRKAARVTWARLNSSLRNCICR